MNLTRLERLTRAATPGPWERGDRYHTAGVGFGNAPGKCVYCDRSKDLVWEGRTGINGTVMQAHVHRDTDPWHDLGIYGPLGVSVVVETDEYGGCSDEDAAFIIEAREAMPKLLALARLVESLSINPVVPDGIRSLMKESLER